MQNIKKFFSTLWQIILIIFAVLILCGILWTVYKFLPHTEGRRKNGYFEYVDYWKWGKVYRQDVYIVGYARPTAIVFYSRKHVPFLIAPFSEFNLEGTIRKEFYEDSNYDGKWDVRGFWISGEERYFVEEDSDYDGTFDKQYYKKQYIY